MRAALHRDTRLPQAAYGHARSFAPSRAGRHRAPRYRRGRRCGRLSRNPCRRTGIDHDLCRSPLEPPLDSGTGVSSWSGGVHLAACRTGPRPSEQPEERLSEKVEPYMEYMDRYIKHAETYSAGPRRQRSPFVNIGAVNGSLARQRLPRPDHDRWHHHRLGTLQPADEPSELLTAVREFNSYLRANHWPDPNYGERAVPARRSPPHHRIHGQPGDQQRMVKKRQMRWTPRGAHLLLQIRTRVLNDQLSADFHRWYPHFARAPGGEVLVT